MGQKVHLGHDRSRSTPRTWQGQKASTPGKCLGQTIHQGYARVRKYARDMTRSESKPGTWWQGKKVHQGQIRMSKYIRVGKYTRDFKRSQVSYTRYTPEPESIQKTAGPDSKTRNQARPESTLGLRLGWICSYKSLQQAIPVRLRLSAYGQG